MSTVAVPQMAVADLDLETNLAEIADRVAALPDRVEITCFPEYALTGFVADDRVRDVTLSQDAPALDRLADLAATHDTAILAGYVEREDGKSGSTEASALYNAAVYVRPSGGRETYRKRHLWAGEQEVLTPGNGDERLILDTPAGKTAVLTCYDLNFVAESAALAEARVDCLLVPGAWPAAHSENWRLLLRARALDGVRWVVGAGRTGRKDVPDACPVGGRAPRRCGVGGAEPRRTRPDRRSRSRSAGRTARVHPGAGLTDPSPETLESVRFDNAPAVVRVLLSVSILLSSVIDSHDSGSEAFRDDRTPTSVSENEIRLSENQI